MANIDQEKNRMRARTMLHLSQPADALYAYYALYHDPRRSQVYIHEDDTGHTDGFVAICQTGQRLFQPTAALRALNAPAAVDLLARALIPNRPYALVTTPDLADAVSRVVELPHPRIHHVYQLNLERFKPMINVLVVMEEGPDGRPHFLIRTQGEVAAEAGFNWISPHFAEVFVQTQPAARRRGWGQAVLAACTTWAIRSAKQPLYIVDEANEPSMRLAQTVGYVESGAREFSGECKRLKK